MLRHIVSVALLITACTSFIPTKVSAATLTVTPVGEIKKSYGESIEFKYVFTPSATVRIRSTWFSYDSDELLFVRETPESTSLHSLITSEPITILRIFSVLTPVKNGMWDTTGQIFYDELDQFGNTIGFGASNVALGADVIPVPEPLTMLGAATALGYGAILKRKSSKKTVSWLSYIGYKL